MKGKNPGRALGLHILDQLTGSWKVSREMPGGKIAHGSARFTPHDGSLHYREEVLVEHKGQTLQAYQEYEYRPSDSGIDVYFVIGENAGKLFMSLSLQATDSGGRAQGTHLCKLDSYTGRFQFEGPDRFVIDYEVQGPNKKYSLRAVYTPTNRNTRMERSIER